MSKCSAIVYSAMHFECVHHGRSINNEGRWQIRRLRAVERCPERAESPRASRVDVASYTSTNVMSIDHCVWLPSEYWMDGERSLKSSVTASSPESGSWPIVV